MQYKKLPQEKFRDTLYLITDEAVIFNASKNKYIQPKNNLFSVVSSDYKNKKISVKTAYKLVGMNYCIDDTETLDGEIWKDIPNTKGEYRVSNYGRIKSLKGYKALIMHPTTSLHYARVDINDSTYLVHRLVAEAFITPPQSLDYVLHHIDRNKLNNRADNLIWVSRTEHSRLHKGDRTNGK